MKCVSNDTNKLKIWAIVHCLSWMFSRAAKKILEPITKMGYIHSQLRIKDPIMTYRILVNGAHGKMGQVCVEMVKNNPLFTLAGMADKSDDLLQRIQSTSANIVVDLTTAKVAYANAKTIIEANVHPVIGTSGFTQPQIDELTTECQKRQLGGIIAPNFSLGVSLMLQCAKQVAAYLPSVEIIEMHHDQKADAPSGTAIKTAVELAKVRQKAVLPACEELIPGARGALQNDIPIHSIRLPGLLAHETIIFGHVGETLRLQHDTLTRESFMPGIALACQRVLQLKTLIYGLENILD